MNNNELSTERTVAFGEKERTITELTIAQIRKIMSTLEQDNSLHIVDDMIDSLIPAIAIAESSGIPISEIEKHTPSDISKLAKEVEQANPFFVKMVKRRIEVYADLKKIIQKEEKVL